MPPVVLASEGVPAAIAAAATATTATTATAATAATAATCPPGKDIHRS